MITIAICLIYYGIAVWLYQVHLWISGGNWVPIPVSVAWGAVFGMPTPDHSILGILARWSLSMPLSLTLLVVGAGTLAAITGLRRAGETRRRQLRRQWISEQCAEAGYTPWNVPKVLADLDAPRPLDHGRRKHGFS